MGLGKAQINSIPLRILGGESGQDTLVVVQVFTFLGSHVQVADLSSVYEANPPVDACRMLAQAFTQDVRFTLDGTDPSSTKGFQLKEGTPPIMLPLNTSTPPKFIAEVAGATLEIQYGY